MADSVKAENVPSVSNHTPVGRWQLSLRPAGQKQTLTILSRLSLVDGHDIRLPFVTQQSHRYHTDSRRWAANAVHAKIRTTPSPGVLCGNLVPVAGLFE